MRIIVFDIECDGLLTEVTHLHCFSYTIYDTSNKDKPNTYHSLTDSNLIKQLIDNNKDAYFCGHNIIRYDIPVLEKLFDIKMSNLKLIDTLGISWYLYPKAQVHGLEYWGTKLGVEKPYIEDWENQSIEDYIHRCESDVKINLLLMKEQFNYLTALYGNFNEFYRLIEHLNFKLDCIREQEEIGIYLDKELCESSLQKLESLLDYKTKVLSALMPKTNAKVEKSKPKVTHKKDGTLSANGLKWFKFLKERNLPEDTEVVYEKPNPGSNNQLKDWLFSLGWKPQTFKVSPNTGEELPQIQLPFGGGICPSILELYKDNPQLKELEDYYMLKHRLGLFKGYIDSLDENGRVYASVSSFTATLRMKHKKPIN